MPLANLCGGTAGINLTPSCGGSDHGLWEAWSKIIRFPPRVTCFPPRVAVAEELSVYSVLCTVKMFMFTVAATGLRFVIDGKDATTVKKGSMFRYRGR